MDLFMLYSILNKSSDGEVIENYNALLLGIEEILENIEETEEDE